MVQIQCAPETEFRLALQCDIKNYCRFSTATSHVLVPALYEKPFDAGGEYADTESPEFLVAQVVYVPTGIQAVDPALGEVDIGHEILADSVEPREQNRWILQQGG